MTALEQYARLESGGLWRPAAEAQRREVTVSFGETTLVMTDSAERPVAHWSLPAIRRLNPGQRPAVFSPDEGEGETLEVDEPDMIAAIETVRRAIAKRRPRPGRLRLTGVLVSLGAIAALLLLWAPGALRDYAVSILPQVKREAIGDALLGRIARVAGEPCGTRANAARLERLRQRLLPGVNGGRLVVLPAANAPVIWLPGDVVVLSAELFEDHESADVAAGYILAAAVRAEAADPLDTLLREAGARASFRLITTGDLDPATLRDYGEVLQGAGMVHPSDAALLSRAEAAGVPVTPYALARDITGESVSVLIENDPYADGSPLAVFPDDDWVALQQICE